MRKDIEIKWSKREQDIQVNWNAGCKGTACYILDMFNKKFQEEMKGRGYDLNSIKFSMNKLNPVNKE
jgi:hypothetical protein